MGYFSVEEMEQAYIKLRSYVYHDNTDLYLRRQLVEFETNITKNQLEDTLLIKSKYRNILGKERRIIKIKDKLEVITEALNNYRSESTFFNELIGSIGINYYPKKIESEPKEKNFITNKQAKREYYIKKVTPFINAPIELHIISVLWIMHHGVQLDAYLGDECFGNRLLLNKEKDQLVKGSGLFRPYFNQYRHWRDKALHNAKQLLNDGRDVAFVNLDIRDYFNSVQLAKTELYTPRENFSKTTESYDNLQKIFLALHVRYTQLLFSEQKEKVKVSNESTQEKDYVTLPIGLVSSYVLANHYLKQFDDNINRHIKPIYYGRYVDDLLFVIADPAHPDDLEKDEFTSNKTSANFTLLEKFIAENLSPVLDIEDAEKNNKHTSSNHRLIQIKGEKYKSLHCQSEKSLVYLFDAEESHLVIDKLKEELEERTSEFRDFPDEEESKGTFTDAAYHLQYEDAKEKVRTLKDYKEDRFGLTLFLANKIFSSLRQEEQLSDEACNSILKFFKHKTAIEFYRLWEKIFTLFLVNNKTRHYVAFYLQCIQEIQNLKTADDIKNHKRALQRQLTDYLDIANEITFSLNLAFYEKAFLAAREFEFKTKEWQADIFFSIREHMPTKADTYWRKRFRRANMLRHHYIIHPLLNYTKASIKGTIKNLVDPHLDFTQFELDEQLLDNSPRRLKFWECNMAQMFVELGNEARHKEEKLTEIFVLNKEIKNEPTEEDEISDDENPFDRKCMLNDGYSLFQKVNQKHIPNYEWDTGGSANRDNIFTIDSIIKSNSPEVWLNEIRVIDDEKKEEFKIAFANTHVHENNILSSIRGKPNLSKDRILRLGNVIRAARKENADILLLPEFFIPIDLLSSMVDYARKNEKMVVTGLEHIIADGHAYNFIITILPVTIGGIKDAIVIPRLKNHYAHIEQHIIDGNHYKVPQPSIYRYDLFIWKNLYFSTYYCFELANIHHRGLWKNKSDLVIGVEWNKDTPYYSNIVEATSRDLHCFFAQVNTSQFGDSRLTKPVESAQKDVLRLKGGHNDALLVATFGTKELREFQRQTYAITHVKKEFKPLPPDFDMKLVLKRINGKSVLRE